MSQQDPWAEFRVGTPAPTPPPAPQVPQYPGIIQGAPDPYKQAAEQRAQQDQALQVDAASRDAERLRLAQENAARTQGTLTEAQGKAAGLLQRAIGANQQFEQTGVGPRSYIGQIVADNAPMRASFKRLPLTPRYAGPSMSRST